MKYSSTTRIVNAVAFLLLFAGFAALGIWAGALITPYLPGGVGPIDLPDQSYGLFWDLGALGFSGALLSLFGFIESILSVIHGNDDKLVRSCISYYIGLGFIAVIWLLLNGAWLYRLTTTNFNYSDMGFPIALYLIVAIIGIVALSIPFVRMHGDDVNENEQMSLLSAVELSINFGVALPAILSAIINANLAGSNADKLRSKLLVLALVSGVACLLSLLSFVFYRRAEKSGKVSKLNALLFEFSLFLDAGGMIGAGVYSYIEGSNSYKHVSLMAPTIAKVNADYMDFTVMSWILGGVLLILVIVLIAQTIAPSKKQVQVAE